MARTLRTPVLASLLLLALLPLAAPAVQAAGATPASAPLDLAAQAGAGASAVLTWDAPAEPGSPHYNQFRILRGEDGAAPSVVATVNQTTLTFTDAGLTPGVLYTYQVQAASKKAAGPASEPATVQVTDAPSVPSAPTLTADHLGDHRIHLQWTFPESWGEGFAGFRVYRGLDGQEPTFYLASEFLEYYDGVEPGHLYTYQVSAVNAAGEGPRSEPASASSGPGAPSAPLGLQAVVDFQAQDAILTWQPPASDGGAAITDYTIVASADGSGLFWVGSVAGDVLTFTHTEFQFGPAYTYYVQAANSVMWGPYSEGAFVQETTVPSAPRGLAAEPLGPGDTRIHVSWSFPETLGGSQFQGYRLYRGVDGEAPTLYVVTDGGEYYDGAEYGRTYVYQVSAVNGVGEGPRSEPVSATLGEGPSVPSAPLNLVAQVGASSVRLTWDPPADDGGAPVFDYRVYRGMDGATPEPYSWANMERDWTDTNVELGRAFTYRVAAWNGYGEGALSDPVDAVMPPPSDRVPSPPRDLTFSGFEHAEDTYSATLSWLAPEDPGDGTVFRYNIYRGGGGPDYDFYAVAYDTTFTDAYLTYGQTYGYRVSAVNEHGEGQQSNAAGTSMYNVPSAPRNVQVPATGQTEATLTWEAPHSDGGLALQGYGVYRSSASEAEGRVAIVEGTSFTDTGLTPGTSYTYRIRASNAFGEGPYSEPVTFSTLPPPATVPDAPQGLALETFYSAVSDYGVQLTWQPPASDGGEAISTYAVYRSVDGGAEELHSHVHETTFFVYGLSYGPTHAFRVTALNAIGEGQPSNTAGVSAYNHPSWVQDLFAYGGPEVGQVVLEWSAPWSTGGLPVDGYNVYRTGPSEPEALVAFTPTAGWTDSAQPGVTYSYRVTAVNALGEGPSWTTVEATATFGDDPPSEPLGLAAAPTAVGEVTLTWQPPADPGDATVTDYSVFSTMPGHGMSLFYLGSTAGPETSFTVDGLAPGEERTYWVAAWSLAGRSPLSAPATVTAFDAPGAPQAVAAATALPGVAVSWQAPASDGGLPVLKYTVYRSVDGGESVVIAVLDAPQTSYQDPDCSLLQVCEYRVTATNLVDEGEQSLGATARGGGLPSLPF